MGGRQLQAEGVAGAMSDSATSAPYAVAPLPVTLVA